MKKKLALLFGYLFIGIGLITAQTQKVTGTVISDDDKQPVVGASIVVKGTNLGTITDIDGHFTLLNVPNSAKILQISYIGMKTESVPVQPTKARTWILPPRGVYFSALDSIFFNIESIVSLSNRTFR